MLAVPSTALRSTLAVLSIIGLAAPAGAQAYSIANAAGDGCHERITAQALRTVRMEMPGAAALPVTADEQALIEDLQFEPDGDMLDLGGATLLIAVRDNDLKGRGANDLTQLAAIHGDPVGQREHCLRGPEDVEPNGSQSALENCREFIRTRFMQALDGLDANGNVDPSIRDSLPIHLALRGDIEASLPTFYVRMGQAIHTIEDSFTHTYRTADGKKVTTVLNWLQSVNGEHVEAEDGPAHSKEMDQCDDADDMLRLRRELATNAATSMLRAALEPELSREEKAAALEDILTEYLSYQAGCTADNAWCNAPETIHQDSSSCACREAENAGGGSAVWSAAALLMFGALLRRRSKHALAAVMVAFACAVPTTAVHAQTAEETPVAETPPAEEALKQKDPEDVPVEQKPAVDDEGEPLTREEREAIPPAPTHPVAEPGSHDPDDVTYGVYAAASGSVDKTAFAASLGGRIRLARSWTFGIDAEWNPWVNMNTTEVRGGTINAFATAIYRIPLAYEDFNLRITGNVGGSYLLSDLYGAPSGSVGLYFGLSPLGLEWKISRLFYLIINPISFSMPIPQLRGVPLTYPQYRFSLGLEFDA